VQHHSIAYLPFTWDTVQLNDVAMHSHWPNREADHSPSS